MEHTGSSQDRVQQVRDVLSATQKKITQAGDELDKLIGTRTNKIMTQLKKVTELPEAASEQILDMAETDGGQYKTAENDE